MTATPTVPFQAPAITAAQRLADDPRVVAAHAQLLAAQHDAAQSLTEPRPALPERTTSYERTLERFGQARGGNLFYPYLGSGLGHGPLVELDDGSVKYDLITGIGVHFFGHSHPGLTEACLHAALADTVMQGNLQQNTDTAQLVDQLLNLANRDQTNTPFAHAFLTSSGAMANENALKLAFQHHHPAARVLTLSRCFCGRTLALSQITDKPAYRQGLPRTLEVDYLPGFRADDPDAGTPHALSTMRRLLRRYPGQHAVLKLELVAGEGGFYPATAQHLRALMQEAKAHGLAVMVDEIQTFGRTLQPFAFQHFGLGDLVDLVTVGKLSQVCATLFKPEYKPKPGLLSQTFTASATAIAAARYTLDQLAQGDLYGDDGRIAQVHRHFVEHFNVIQREHPDRLEGPFGLGGMIACTPFGGDPTRVRAFLHRLFELGVIAFLAGGGPDPVTQPTRLRFLPPVPVLTDAHIDAVADLLRQALNDVAQQPTKDPQ
ncbi:MAG: aminotransferase class III-fold pyridoxal phosphate-dependent enzyme [Planctomycetota bacterium]